MEKLFTPVKDLIGSIYDVVYDAAQKVWSLVKPLFLIGVTFDLVTGKLGWVNSLLEYYHQTLNYTSGTNWLVLIIGGLFLLAFCTK